MQAWWGKVTATTLDAPCDLGKDKRSGTQSKGQEPPDSDSSE